MKQQLEQLCRLYNPLLEVLDTELPALYVHKQTASPLSDRQVNVLFSPFSPIPS